ncbi:inclusion-associated protein [Chlamydia suis]|uniref:inclusion-associated protein n=1 Tax=Chlamydia suis TaxID=83559 RepID=UPI0009B0D2EE|nr:inclusion-associated protein [Chlamydia suis]
MPSSHYFPFFCAAIIIHIALGGVLLLSSPPTPKPKLRSFKERIVSFPLDPKITCQTPIVVSPSAQPSPIPKQKVPLSEKKHPTKPPEPPSSFKPSQAPISSKPSQEKKLATLKKLAQLANQLAKDAEAQESHITQLSLPMQVQVSAETAYQQEAFCALFQQYVCLPFPGEIRLKLEFSKEGALVHCSILSSISPTDKQHLLSQIQKIPFQSFFNTYKPSKNIIFHIRLQGSPA